MALTTNYEIAVVSCCLDLSMGLSPSTGLTVTGLLTGCTFDSSTSTCNQRLNLKLGEPATHLPLPLKINAWQGI